MFTYFDVIVSVIVIICTLTSYMRGFIRDALSLMVWFGAGLLTLLFFPFAADMFESVFRHSVVVSVVAVVIVYVIFLFILSIVNNLILSALSELRGGTFDKLLGIFFGIGKGFAIASLIHFSIAEIAGDSEPEWLIGETYPLTEKGADVISGWTEGFFDTDKAEEVLEDIQEDPAGASEAYQEELIEYYTEEESAE